jgi:hypothetical protein
MEYFNQSWNIKCTLKISKKNHTFYFFFGYFKKKLRNKNIVFFLFKIWNDDEKKVIGKNIISYHFVYVYYIKLIDS